MKIVMLAKSLFPVLIVAGAGFFVWARFFRKDDCDDGCDVRRGSSESVACRLDAFTPDERTEHLAATVRLVEEVRSRRELADGWEIDIAPEALGDAARWFVDERRCCPFLSFEVSLVSEAAVASVRLRGPDGAKEILRPILGSSND